MATSTKVNLPDKLSRFVIANAGRPDATSLHMATYSALLYFVIREVGSTFDVDSMELRVVAGLRSADEMTLTLDYLTKASHIAYSKLPHNKLRITIL
ncbi:hypothetical protein [Spirosoma sordidisoli]|uniref:Uncharacterized protein n=1 Tax=Spirosoma sordidisoli TaxID=2502893 RepID=A0A4Q2UPW5_9BACT|nr:hypothetical protein [Spirosoma sordidisoli]RYC69660.1 hypothetical protein EQG79_13750 [Spirosoma sordidisoli]